MSWQTITVAEIANQVRGVSYDKSQVSSNPSEGLIPILRAGNIQNGSLLLHQDLVFVPESCVSLQQLLRPGDIVVAASSGSIDVVGKAAQIQKEWQGSFGAFCKVVRPTSDRIDPRYLHHFFQSSGYRHKVSSLAAGANINNLKNEHIDDLEIPLPPLEEQRRIAAILDKVRSIQNSAEARKEALRSFEESLFNHLFGSTYEQRSRWAWEPFGSLCSRLTVGVVVKPASYYRETGVPALRSLNVKPGAVVEKNLVYISEEHNDGVLSKSRLSCGDLVFVRSGRPGTCAVIPPSLDGCNAIDLLLATADTTRILPGFASSYFNSAGGRASIFAESRGQVQQHFNAGSLASALVPVPPIEIQLEFSNILRARNSQLNKCNFSFVSLMALSKALEKSLMSGTHP